MILINALTSIPSGVYDRIYMRNQFDAAGLQASLLPRLEAFNYNLLDIQIESYKEAVENDMEDAFGDELAQFDESKEPSELFDLFAENISDSRRGTEYLLSALKHLSWIKGDVETK